MSIVVHGRQRINQMLNSFLAGGDFFRLLITFANTLDPDQDQHSIGPDLGKKNLTLR